MMNGHQQREKDPRSIYCAYTLPVVVFLLSVLFATPSTAQQQELQLQEDLDVSTASFWQQNNGTVGDLVVVDAPLWTSSSNHNNHTNIFKNNITDGDEEEDEDELWGIPEEYQCTDSGNDECALTHQLCWKPPPMDTGTNEQDGQQDEQQCGYCLPGFVDWDDDHDDATTNCRKISELTVQQFWTLFSPLLLDPNFHLTVQGVVTTVQDIILTSTNTNNGTTNNNMTTAELAEIAAALAEQQQQQQSSSANVPTLQERLAVLQQRAEYIAAHNRQMPPPHYSLGLNAFSMDSDVEQDRRLGYVGADSDGNTMLDLFPYLQVVVDAVNLPQAVDWVQAGAVTSVKNQGNCGCCWSISIAGAIEGAAAIGSNFTFLQSVSFQQMISCLTPDVNSFNCHGGFTGTALQYAIQNPFGGMTTLNDYPFVDGLDGNATKDCDLPVTNGVVVVVEESSDTIMPLAVQPQDATVIVHYDTSRNGGNDTLAVRMLKLKHAVARQPVSISMHAECSLMYAYQSGVVTDDAGCQCSPQGTPCLNHAVLLVGYNDTHEEPYWLIKNSWGPDWGEDGYIRVAQRVPTTGKHHNNNNNNTTTSTTSATNTTTTNESSYDWGLFGMLAEGLTPLIAYNVTEQEDDLPQAFPMVRPPVEVIDTTTNLPPLMDQTWKQILWAVLVFVGAGVLAVVVASLYHHQQSAKAVADKIDQEVGP